VEYSVRDRQVHSMSRLTGVVQEAAKPDPRFEDPKDGSEISSVLFQALRGVTQLGEQGEATKKALLLAIEAAAKMGRPNREAAREPLELGAGATGEPREEAARLARVVHHCFNMMARQVVSIKVLIEQGYATTDLTVNQITASLNGFF